MEGNCAGSKLTTSGRLIGKPFAKNQGRKGLKLGIKEALMSRLSEWIDQKKLKQADAARILGVTRPRVSDVINKKTPKFTIDALVDMLARAGMRVQLSVKDDL